jgi:hypothetical protein
MLLRRVTFFVTAGVFLLLLSGCATVHNPYLAADRIAESNGWQEQIIATGHFDLQAYHRLTGTTDQLTIYIEGDGNAWRTRHSLSSDPTPRNPLVMQLAALDSSANLAYLGRPCQYVLKDGHGRNCNSKYWSSGRFSSEVVVAMNEAITLLKKQAGASGIHLVGYSGGGAVAVLAAAGRDDIASLRTIAGNLDHAEFTRNFKVTPLTESLNPVDSAQTVSKIPQIHFSGGKDRIVPESVADKFMSSLPENNCASLVLVKGVSHSKGWQVAWPELLQRVPPCF